MNCFENKEESSENGKTSKHQSFIRISNGKVSRTNTKDCNGQHNTRGTMARKLQSTEISNSPLKRFEISCARKTMNQK